MPTTMVVLILAGILSASSTAISPWARQQRTPGPRLGHSLVYDERLGGVVLLDGHWPHADRPAGDVWRWRDRRWEHLSDSAPPATTMGAAVSDARRNRVVMHGGRDVRGATGALWEWSAEGRRTASDTTPGRRFHHGMAYDAARGRTVMYGGATAARWDTDTWEWDGSTWTRLAVPGPGPRAAFRMAYDKARGVVVLFGGIGPPKGDGEAQDYLGDTWLWNGSAWRRASTSGPAGRRDYSMTYDEHHRVVLLHGGAAGSGPATRRYSDMWAWDGERWRELPQRDTTPGHRYLSAMVYDAVRDRVLLYGGYSCDRDGRSCGVRDDTWEWDGARWARITGER